MNVSPYTTVYIDHPFGKLHVVAEGTGVREKVVLGEGVEVIVEVRVDVSDAVTDGLGVKGVIVVSVTIGVVVNANTCALFGIKISVAVAEEVG